jgi:hypothetical protein
MAKLDDILESIDLQNRVVTLILGIEDLILYAYGGDEFRDSPEVIEKAKACFSSLEQHLSQKEIVFLPGEIGNLISSYLLDECKDKVLFHKLLVNKFSSCDFDTDNEYGCFYDYCKAADRPDIAEAAFVFMGGLRTLAENLNVLFSTQQNLATVDSESRYEYDPAFCTAVYDFCITTRVFSGITHADFCACVAEANFAPIYNSEGRLAAKLKYIIYVLSRRMNNPQWYSDSAHSIDTEPNKCSGAGVPPEWKRQALAIK